MTRLVRDWWEQKKKDLGDIVSVRQLHMLTRDFEGEPELQIFLLIRLAKGEQLVRAIRSSAGRLYFNVEKTPQRLELTLAPQGNNLYSSWSIRFQTAARIEITPGALIIHGRTASTIARRQEL
jgi:hypothetical protein